MKKRIQSRAMKNLTKSKLRLIIFTSVGMLLLAACGQGVGSPGDVVEDYLAALVAKDNIAAVNLSCAAWEANADVEGAAFEGVEVVLEEVTCTVAEESGDSATVTCTGRIVFSYAGGESEEIDLSSRDYSLVLEGGEWRMCGYK
jgi:galactitol-specific phosphotransferase system IIB component